MAGVQVYLQVAQTGEALDWNARFSGMMFKVLQDSYASSGLSKESDNRIEHLASMSPDNSGWRPVSRCAATPAYRNSQHIVILHGLAELGPFHNRYRQEHAGRLVLIEPTS